MVFYDDRNNKITLFVSGKMVHKGLIQQKCNNPLCLHFISLEMLRAGYYVGWVSCERSLQSTNF